MSNYDWGYSSWGHKGVGRDLVTKQQQHPFRKIFNLVTKNQICRWHHPHDSKEELKSLLKVKEESERAGLKLNIYKIMASGHITSWQIDRQTVETVTNFILGTSKSLQMVIAAMKLKDACSLEENLWPT